VAGCTCDGPPDAPPSGAAPATAAGSVVPAARDDRWRELRFPPASFDEPEMAAVLLAKGAPLLVALHGRGEAGRGVEAGARGWRDDYWLDRADRRLREPPLRDEDLLGFVHPDRLAALNASLAREPYRGLTVACPYTPALDDRDLDGARPFGRFVTDVLLPSVRRELGGPDERARTGIDGVSMGGRLALLVGLSNPHVFGAVAALQPAINPDEANWLADLAQRAAGEAPLRLRLVSSDDDPFLEAVQALAAALGRRGVAHQLVVTPGPHDYAWNRGPGSYEMLLWHERALRGLEPP
jgi:iron(III)-salmochelin esterase